MTVFSALRPRLALLAAFPLLIALPASQASANFPGANGKLAISKGNTVESISSDGTGLSTLIGAGQGTDGALSPDATQLAFASSQSTNDHLMVAFADGSGSTAITTPPSGGSDRYPAWSPDGTRLAFERHVAGQAGIWVVNADGTGLHQLTDGTGAVEERRPSWSPDGTKIAYVKIANAAANGLWVMNSDGSGQDWVVHTAGGDNLSSVDWSPDGTKLAYTDYSSAPRGGIYVKQYGSIDGPTQILPIDFVDPVSWSPDGTRLAFASQHNTGVPPDQQSFDWDVYSVASDGTDLTRLTTTNSDYRNGVSWGTIPPPAPTVTTGAASSVAATGATLNGKVNPQGGATQCRFEYGTSTSYGSSVSCSAASLSGAGDEAVIAALTSLQPGTTYHFRVVAVKGGQTSRGADQSLTTAKAPAAITGDAPAPATDTGQAPTIDKPVTADPLAAVRQAVTVSTVAITGALQRAGLDVLTRAVSSLVPFTAPGPGAIEVRYEATQPRGKSARSAANAKQVVIAAGRKTVTAAGQVKVRVKLTPAGRKLVQRAKHMTLTVSTAFTPAGAASAQTSSRKVTLKRKAHG